VRLWTVHPAYLDAPGLVALWREALLAQKVLLGLTRGYRFHPQLIRFRQQSDPVAAIGAYLAGVHAEALRRGYRFDAAKIVKRGREVRMHETKGQLLHEWQHLRRKLRLRGARRYAQFARLASPAAHPIFRIVAGGVRAWERAAPAAGQVAVTKSRSLRVRRGT